MSAFELGRGNARQSIVALGVGLACGALVLYSLPFSARNPLGQTAAWAIVVLVSFVGWGSLVRFVVARDARVDVGLRASWGAGLVCFIGGTLMVPALMKRLTALVLVDTGLILAALALVRERAAFHSRARFVARIVKREPGLAVVAGIVVCLVAIQFLAAIADWHTNPYDDDIAYLAFVRKLSDTGSVLEPFSFRRLSALGGQTLFLLILSIRAAPSQAFTFDHGICVVLVAMLIAGHRSHGRRASLVVVLLCITFFVTLPSTAINTASYYSGVVFFVALFRTMVWLDDHRLGAWQAAVPLALLSAAACTLRQNYLPVPVFLLAASYGFGLFRSGETWRRRLVEPLLAGLFTLVALTPWLIVSWQSSRTFLYPLMPGTFNRALDLKAAGMTIFREIWYQIWTALDGVGIRTFGLFVLAAALLRERSARKPLWSLAIGAASGFTLLVHGLTQSDAANSGRYAFSFLMAFAIAVTLATGTMRLGGRYGREHLTAGIVLFAVLAQLVLSRDQLSKTYATAFHNIEELHFSAPRGPKTEPYEAGLYARLQETVPAGERLAVLLDEPHYLNFERNPVWNLDMPGYASLPPGMPFFKGSSELAAYFRTLGVRYIAFVRSEYSRYHYRREYWVEMLASEQEVWRAFSPYLLDFMDMIADLAQKHRKLFEEKGLLVVDLAEAP